MYTLLIPKGFARRRVHALTLGDPAAGDVYVADYRL